MLDLIVKNGKIIDGTGREKYFADLGVQGEKITRIGDLQNEKAAKIIDAKGKFVTPGFIDPHSHADLNLLIWPENEGNVMQGVTTTIGGNCGFSPAPIKDVWAFAAWEYRLSHQISPQYYNEIQDFLDLQKMKKALKELYDCDVDYENMEGFFNKAETQGFSVNLYPFVGHNNLRLIAMGTDCKRAATKEELEKMKVLLHQEMEAGCRGLSTGLDYLPGSYGTTEEIIELAKVAKEYEGMYVSHFRGYHAETYEKNGLIGIEEAIRIGKESGIQVNLSHMMPALNIDRDDSLEKKIEAAQQIKELINKARDEGIQISYDVIPNVSGGGCTDPNFARLLRPWILAAGSVEQFIQNLNIPDYVEFLKRDAKTGNWIWANLDKIPDLDGMIYIIRSQVKAFENKTLKQIMNEKEWKLVDAIIEIYKADPDTKMRLEIGTPNEFLKEILDYPYAMPSSDGLSYNQDANIGLDYPLNKLPHPNNFCYTVRYLTMYQKERIEDTIRTLTGLPADIFHLKDRGILKEGNYADIVVFTLEDLATNESYVNPTAFPDGIDYIIINGQITGNHKQHTGVKAGKILKNIDYSKNP
ncbi:MAG: N-acyl-D-amino-acid deacylase family protein [Promethearchaeota archaeon]